MHATSVSGYSRHPVWLAAAIIAATGLLVGCREEPGAPEAPMANLADETNTTAATPAIKPEFAKLPGKWQRPDGGYVLEIRNIDGSGKMDALYFNPRPINISRALALREGENTKIFVELRDEGYPGCTYSLQYDAKSDQLYGDYFQAAMQQTYDVIFARYKE